MIKIHDLIDISVGKFYFIRNPKKNLLSFVFVEFTDCVINSFNQTLPDGFFYSKNFIVLFYTIYGVLFSINMSSFLMNFLWGYFTL